MEYVEENYKHKYRIDLMWHEYNALIDLIKEAQEKDIYVNVNLIDRVEERKAIKISYAKLEAITKASQKRTKQAKTKFESAVAELLRQGVELTSSKISKQAKISFATAKKYLKQFNEGEYRYANL
jgi:Fic family protein